MCMVYQGDLVLALDRVSSRWGGLTFPGGHVEANEAFADSVIREMWEETGLTIAAPQLCGIKDWVNEDGSRFVVLLYKTDRFSGELRASEEGAVFWIRLEELLSMEERLAPDMKAMLQVFLQDDLSEFFYYQQDGKWKYALK